jgi:hypothetical protein
MPALLARTPAMLALVAVLLTGAVALAHAREQRYPAPAVTREALYFTSGPALRRLTTGYRALAADVYWIRALQYFGGVRLRLAASPPPADAPGSGASDYELLYPLLDLTTSLDPRFSIAYRFGAIFLAEPFPGGAGRPDLAVKLLEKGFREQPDKWEYLQDLGFVHYWWRHDYKTAAEWFNRAAALPGAPWFLKSLAATTLAEGGDRGSSRTMWEAIRQSAESDWLRHEAERRLVQLQAMDQIDLLQREADRASQASGTPASDWRQVLGRIPADPMNVPYQLEGGRVRISRFSPLYPLPDEPQRQVNPGP